MSIDSLPFDLYFLAKALAGASGWLGQNVFPRRRRNDFWPAGLVVSLGLCRSSFCLLPHLILKVVCAGFGFTHFAVVAAVRPDVAPEPI